MPIPEYTNWPAPDSLLLAGIVSEIRGRSKSLKHRVSVFDISVSAGMEDGEEFERLDIEMRSVNDRPNRLSLAFWDDGSLWLDARRSTKSGWDYEFSFWGEFEGIEPAQMRDMIEESLWVTDRSDMKSIWHRCNPTSE